MFDNTRPNVILLTDSNESAPVGRMLGVARVTQELRNAGFEVAVVYYAGLFEYDELCRLLEHLISDQTLFVGVSNWLYATYPMVNDEHRILPTTQARNKDFKTWLRQVAPKCQLVLGGPSAADVDWNRYFDYVILGYAEISIVNLARHLSAGEKLLKSYRSIHGFTVINDSRAEGFDISKSYTEYLPQDAVLPGETLHLEIARGCIFQCAFCGFPMNGKKKFDYMRDFDVLYTELVNNYEQHGVTTYMFNDDTFNDSIEKVHLINQVSKRLPFKLNYWAYIRLDLLVAHPGSVDLLWESGLRSAFFGIESWNPATGKIIGKKADKRAHLDMVRYIKQTYGDEFYTTGSFIIGLPQETVASINDTMDALTSPECMFDFVHMGSLFIKRREISSNGFISKIQANYEEYGYRDVGRDQDMMLWENDHMDWRQALELSDQFAERFLQFKGLDQRHFCGEEMMWRVGLGIDHAEFVKMQREDLPGLKTKIETLRFQRTFEYKKKLIKELGLPPNVIKLVSPYHDEWWRSFYNDIRDPSWPTTPDLASFDSLPRHVQQECHDTAISCKNQQIIPAMKQLFSQHNEIAVK